MASEYNKIKVEVIKRKISRLCHFTQSRKLPHILGSPGGIYSIEWLEKNQKDIIDRNDLLRLDGFPNYISCSIEHPNTWYLSKAKQRDPLFKDWVILLISPELLWKSKTKFSYRNAAAIKQSVLGGLHSFNKMYSNSIIGAYGREYKRGRLHLESCPTDGQAEVLVHEYIPKELIEVIAVKSKDQAALELNRLDTLGIDLNNIKILVAPYMFNDEWRKSVERGIYLNGEIFNVSS